MSADVTAHVPVVVLGVLAGAELVMRFATPSLKSSVVSSVFCGGTIWILMLSSVPRDLSEPKPRRPLLRPWFSPSTTRGP